MTTQYSTPNGATRKLNGTASRKSRADVPPHDMAAEYSVVGSILIDPGGQLDVVAGLLRPEDFHFRCSARTFAEILAMRSEGVGIDITTLARRLTDAGAMGDDVTTTDLGEMVESVPTAANAPDYAEIVASLAERRRVMLYGDRLKAMGADGYRGDEEYAAWRAEIQAMPGLMLRELPSEELAYQPFPTDALPEPIRGFVRAGAAAIGCDESFVALPMLSALAAAIGNTRRVEIKRGWKEPAIIWTAVIGESGTAKSPALEFALGAIYRKQQQAIDQFDRDIQEYDTKLLEWEQAKHENHRNKKPDKSALEPKPAEPVPVRYLVDDITVEALARRHQDQLRGLLLARDELAGWIKSHDQYKSTKGADAANWLSVWSGRRLTVDRSGAGRRPIFVPHASVSITGGIQPAILARALGREHFDNGMAARLLLAMPPRVPRAWSDAQVDRDTLRAVDDVFGRLYALEPEQDGDGGTRPGLVKLATDAKRLFIAFVDEHGAATYQHTGDLAAAYAKLEAYAARLALVFHSVRVAAGDIADDADLDGESLAAAIMLVQWFGREAERVYAVLRGDGDHRERGSLIDWIAARGGQVTARDLQRSRGRHYKNANEATRALDALAQAGKGHWQTLPPGPSGGHPARVFVLGRADTTSAAATKQ